MCIKTSRRSLLVFGIALLLCIGVFACSMGIFSLPEIRYATRNDVVNIGDSMFSFTKVTTYLHDLYGGTFRRYSKSGALLSGSTDPKTPDVEQQYAKAKGQNPNIVTLYMNGGGNDIMADVGNGDPYGCITPEGGTLSSSCKGLIDDVYVELVDFLNQVGSQGVRNVIFMGYGYGKIGLMNENGSKMNPCTDYAAGKFSLAVQNATSIIGYRGFIDLRPVLTDADFSADGMHPNDSGSQKCANLIWERLQPLL